MLSGHYPSSCPSPRGEKGPPNSPRQRFERALSQPHPLADAATPGCKLAKACLRGERQSEHL